MAGNLRGENDSWGVKTQTPGVRACAHSAGEKDRVMYARMHMRLSTRPYGLMLSQANTAWQQEMQKKKEGWSSDVVYE